MSFFGTLVIGDRLAKPGEDPGDFLGMCCGVPVFIVMANVCYSLGAAWARSRRLEDPVQEQQRRAQLFRAGMVFAVVVTLRPLLFSALALAKAWARSDAR